MTGIPAIFDHRLLAAHRRRAERLALPGRDFLLAYAVDDLVDRLAAVNRRFVRAADIGALSDRLGDTLLAGGYAETVGRIDLFGGSEALGLPEGSIDLAMSAVALQFANDLPGILAQVRRALRPDGLFLAVLLGGETLAELRSVLAAAESEIRGGAAPRVAPFADLRDLGGLLQRTGFTLPVIDSDRITVRYDTLFDLVRDLRAMGATSPLSDRDPRPLTRAIAARAATLYAERFADADGRIRASFEFISLSGWAPHESQQKPLRPGSAKFDLQTAIESTRRRDVE